MNSAQNKEPETLVDFDLFPKEEPFTPESYLNLTVHITHDWYSEDSEHGQALLASFISALANSEQKVAILLLSGSAVRMIKEDSPLHNDLLQICNNSLLTGACIESMDTYGIDPSEASDIHITTYTAHDLALEVISAAKLITL